jgi:hypothetical protein
MAYINQETKSLIKPNVDKILKSFNLKGSLSIHNHMELVLTIRSGAIDFGGRQSVGKYHLEQSFSGDALDALGQLYAALNSHNYDNSDAQSDYFDVGYYVTLQIGEWNKPYKLVA